MVQAGRWRHGGQDSGCSPREARSKGRCRQHQGRGPRCCHRCHSKGTFDLLGFGDGGACCFVDFLQTGSFHFRCWIHDSDGNRIWRMGKEANCSPRLQGWGEKEEGGFFFRLVWLVLARVLPSTELPSRQSSVARVWLRTSSSRPSPPFLLKVKLLPSTWREPEREASCPPRSWLWLQVCFVSCFVLANLTRKLKGTQKLVADHEAILTREREYCLTVESARVRDAYKIPGSQIVNSVYLKGTIDCKSNRSRVF